MVLISMVVCEAFPENDALVVRHQGFDGAIESFRQRLMRRLVHYAWY